MLLPLSLLSLSLFSPSLDPSLHPPLPLPLLSLSPSLSPSPSHFLSPPDSMHTLTGDRRYQPSTRSPQPSTTSPTRNPKPTDSRLAPPRDSSRTRGQGSRPGAWRHWCGGAGQTTCTSPPAQRWVIYCPTTSVSAAHATHCATCRNPCRPIIRAFSRWIRPPPPTQPP